jgi:hypothetical protein
MAGSNLFPPQCSSDVAPVLPRWEEVTTLVASSFSSRTRRAGPGVALGALVVACAGPGWAQTADATMHGTDPTRFEGPVGVVLTVAAGVLLVLGLVGKVLDLRLKRDGETVAVKGLIADALDSDPDLFGLPLTATVRVPLWSGSPVIIRVAGEVPSGELKRAVLLRVKRTATAELSVRVRIKSRIGVIPTASTRREIRRARSG